MTRAVFVDRDGVINQALIKDGRPHAPLCAADLVFLPGAKEAVRALRGAGFRVIVVTNQPDVAVGALSREVLDEMHRKVRDELAVDDIKVCCHTDADACACRKPKPGMLVEAAREHGVELARSYMVGDRWRDIAAGRAAGCKTLLVRGTQAYAERQAENPDAVVDSLSAASALILASTL